MTDNDNDPPPVNTVMESVDKLLARDLKVFAKTLGVDEARFLVDAYYMMQRNRIRAAHQSRMLKAGGEPHAVIEWLFGQTEKLEKQVAKALDYYSVNQTLGMWARSIVGVGPIITAGFLAHIDVEKADTVGSIWRFAGLDPTSKWLKGQKRPWNASLKRLCWILGESFVKTQNHERSDYGPIYRARKDREQALNAEGKFADQAKEALATKNFGADTNARKHYEAGHLPPARIHLRSTRYAVKLFLSAYHECAYFLRYDKLPPRPYVIEHLGHVHYIAPPNMHLVPGWEEAHSNRPKGDTEA